MRTDDSGRKLLFSIPPRRVASPTATLTAVPGFSMLELLITIVVVGVIAAFARPNALNYLRAYRLHSDASAIASQMNVARFRASSQNTPYRINFILTAGRYARERLSTSYGSPSVDFGPIPLSTNITFLSAAPVTTKPGTIPSTFNGVSSSIYFNTRGLPVDNTGAPQNTNVIYLQNENNVYDAITVTLGGRVTVWNYDAGSGAWKAR